MLYTSKQYLQNRMGVDAEIAAFFVDRPVPPDNLYWKDRYLYVSKGTGFLFIPLYFDLMYRAGVSKEALLQEEFVVLTEKILHSAAMHEYEMISLEEHVDNCKVLLTDKVANLNLYTDLSLYFSNHAVPYNYLGTFSSALNRGDTYLFALCSLAVPDYLVQRLVAIWYILIPSFLLMDDVMDLEEDNRKGEENSIRDFGAGSTGVRNAIAFLTEKFTRLKELNPLLGAFFERSLQRKEQTPYILSLLNQ
ncbi:MAG: hypothetical protein INR73_05320 [Williamsia sp.]|nr:hypothetical protein [Williamsia sp.]